MAPSSIVAARKRVVNKTKQSGNKKQKHDFRREEDDKDDDDSDTETNNKENKDDDSDDDDENNNKKSTENSFENHVAEKEQQVSDKNVTGIIDLLLESFPERWKLASNMLLTLLYSGELNFIKLRKVHPG